MIVHKTLKEEKQRVNELFAIAFELPLNAGPAQEDDSGCHHWAAFDEDGRMMSTFTISDFNIQFDGHSCKMGGVGGVATLPQYRRKGGIRACFEKCLPDLYENGYLFSYLYPFSTGYYRKFGFECCVQTLQVKVDLGLLKPGTAEGRFCLCEADHPMTQAIRAVDQHWEKNNNMMVIHDDGDYDWTTKFDPAGNLNFTYVYFDPNGTPKAYTTFRMENQPDGRNLQCSKFFFVDTEGFNGLMHIFKSLASDHRYVKFALPAGQSMEYLMPEWSMGAAEWSVQNAGMVRVINVREVMMRASCHGSGSLVMDLQDPQIPQNNGRFRFVFENGKAVSFDPTEDGAEISLTIPAFSALISGAGNLQWLPGFSILKPTKAISQVFRRKPIMIADYF